MAFMITREYSVEQYESDIADDDFKGIIYHKILNFCQRGIRQHTLFV